ncbi:uncharacterized protein B0H64DRAFT_219382 [Chaetomium fimeti]|uniref:Uncharacterized protein n=1 Tax=Chaetomium fimeti TaxID=1854472 RepID=A0AAE0HBX9_9PEZI|nr:hypothetical protein B0H64DRAFT_219382 [Chaetomium fimeti]
MRGNLERVPARLGNCHSERARLHIFRGLLPIHQSVASNSVPTITLLFVCDVFGEIVNSYTQSNVCHGWHWRAPVSNRQARDTHMQEVRCENRCPAQPVVRLCSRDFASSSIDRSMASKMGGRCFSRAAAPSISPVNIACRRSSPLNETRRPPLLGAARGGGSRSRKRPAPNRAWHIWPVEAADETSGKRGRASPFLDDPTTNLVHGCAGKGQTMPSASRCGFIAFLTTRQGTRTQLLFQGTRELQAWYASALRCGATLIELVCRHT